MKKNKRLTSKAWLFVFVLLFWGLVGSPVSAQEATPTPEATPKIEATPAATESPRPRTVGDVLTKIADSQDEAKDKTEADDTESKKELTDAEIPPGQKLHFKDKDDSKKQWADDSKVGESTFIDKLVTVSWSLGLIAFLIWISAKIANKAGLKQVGVVADKSSMIEVLEKKRLSPGRTIIMMRVGPKVLAVAATETGYETLTEFDQEEFKQYQDSVASLESEGDEEPPPDGMRTPGQIAQHYLSIIPGLGSKK